MKTLLSIALLTISLSTFAQSFECQDNSLGSISKIKVELHHNDVFISEIDDNDEQVNLVVTSQDLDGNFTAELKDFFGYTRTMIKDGDSVVIETGDECSSSISNLKCE